MRLRFAWLPLIIALTHFSTALAESPAPQLRVTDVEGPAAIIPKGSTTASPVVKGLLLQPGDRLVTNGKGRVEMGLKSGTVLELKEKSYCKIQSVSSGKTSFFLKVGRLLGKFAPSKDTGMKYRLRTPVVVASVRGTELGLAVDDAGSTDGGVIEGVVDFQRPLYAPNATMNWSDDDPKWDEEEKEMASPIDVVAATATVVDVEKSSAAIVAVADSSATISVGESEGISVKPNLFPQKLPTIPPVVVADLAWFASVRERVPKLRDQWKDLDVPSQMKMRQAALRDRIKWEIPAKLQPARISPAKISPKKYSIPKPR